MKTIKYLMAFVSIFALWSCDDYETYGERKEKERDAIQAYIKNNNIKEITEEEFKAKGCTTDTTAHEFVYLEKSGIWMQVVRKGEGTMLENKKTVNVLVRYLEYNIQEEVIQTTNFTSPNGFDKMTVYREGSSYTASFVSGVMNSTYGASVPAGWLVPLDYVTLARPTSNEALSEVRLIVPHSQGTSSAQSSVYPCLYYITYERAR